MSFYIIKAIWCSLNDEACIIGPLSYWLHNWTLPWINIGSGFIDDKYFVSLQERPCKTYKLLLTNRKVLTSLFQEMIQFIFSWWNVICKFNLSQSVPNCFIWELSKWVWILFYYQYFVQKLIPKFARTLSEKITGSCGMIEICCRSCFKCVVLVASPLTNISPDIPLLIRNNAEIKLLFPAPVRPTLQA